jgi:hypothetical protein
MALATATGDAAIVATYRDGHLDRRELDAWRRHLGHQGAAAPARADVEDLVLIKVLASRFDGVGSAADYSRQQRLLALDLAESALRDRLASGIHVTPAEVTAAQESDPSSQPQPRRYALENILKRCSPGCPPDERLALRRRLEDLQRRVLAGEDFAALAQQESDSETRLRGGQMGYVALERLAPEVASAVRNLRPGQLVIVESQGGPTLLRLSRILEPEAPDPDAAQRRLEARLGKRKLEAAWQEASQALLDSLTLELHDPSPGAAPETIVASYRSRGDEKPRDITLADFKAFLEKRGLPPPEDMTTPEGRREALLQRVLLEARHAEAEGQGLLGEDYAQRLEWKSLELRAQLAANALAGPVREPSLDELRAAYDQGRDQYRRPARWRLSALRLGIDPSQPASLYEEMRLLGENARAGAVSFAAVADRLRSRAHLEDLGWLTEVQVWRLGLNADHALQGLPAGATTRAFQEGRELIILHVADRDEDRPLSFEEARPTVRVVLLANRRRGAGDSLRRSILLEQDIRVRP